MGNIVLNFAGTKVGRSKKVGKEEEEEEHAQFATKSACQIRNRVPSSPQHSSADPENRNALNNVVVGLKRCKKMAIHLSIHSSIPPRSSRPINTHTHAIWINSHFYSNHQKKKKKGKVAGVGCRVQDTRWRKMEEEEDYWYYTLIELSLSGGDPPHASLTYVLTATTSPMMHLCGGGYKDRLINYHIQICRFNLETVCQNI